MILLQRQQREENSSRKSAICVVPEPQQKGRNLNLRSVKSVEEEFIRIAKCLDILVKEVAV